MQHRDLTSSHAQFINHAQITILEHLKHQAREGQDSVFFAIVLEEISKKPKHGVNPAFNSLFNERFAAFF